MSVSAELRWHTDEHGIAHVIPIANTGIVDQSGMIEGSLAAAQQRIAHLEERLVYLEGLSVTDELTRVLNRRGFIIELTRALAAAGRQGPPGVLILCDLDGFKAVNDRHGHRSGNDVLRLVAATLRRRVRKNDVVGRLGGDEFALLLIGTSLSNARRKCLCLTRALGNALPRIGGISISLNASFGLAAFDGSEDHEMLLHRADMAMYEEKRRHSTAAAVL
jgi:diguanylate cyclase (GGDEF)-like protein